MQGWLISDGQNYTVMKKLLLNTLVMLIGFTAQSQWLYPTDKFYTDGIHRLSFLTQGAAVGIDITPTIEQFATAIGICDSNMQLQNFSCYGVALALNKLKVVGQAGNITVKLMRADGGALCNNDSSHYTILCNRRLKNAPGTVIYQQTFNLDSINQTPDPNGGNFNWAVLNFNQSPQYFNSYVDDVLMVFDVSNLGDDSLSILASIDEFGTSIIKNANELCWSKANYIYSFGVLPLLKNDPFLVYSKKVNKCVEGDANLFSNQFNWQYNGNSVSVCKGDSLLLKPNARFGFGKAFDFEINQPNSNLPYTGLINNFVLNNCGATIPLQDYGFLVVADSSNTYQFNWPDSSYVSGILATAAVQVIDKNTINTNTNLNLCPGSNPLTAIVTGAAHNIIWRGGLFNDSTTSTPIYTAINDTIISITTITNNGGCMATKNINVTVKYPHNQQLCRVTVDSTSARNIIEWQEIPNVEVRNYNIYRSIVGAANNYITIGSLLDSTLTSFVDSTADIKEYSYQYRVTTSDNCYNESNIDSSNAINTILLKIDNSGVLSWNNYTIGDSLATDTINVWRMTPDKAWAKIATLNPSQTTFTDTLLNTFLVVNYKIEAQILEGKNCFNAVKKSVFSNSVFVSETGLKNESMRLLSLFPNPTSGKLYLSGSNDKIQPVYIYDILGQLVFETSLKPIITNEIDLSNLTNGMYIIKFGNTNNAYRIVLNK